MGNPPKRYPLGNRRLGLMVKGLVFRVERDGHLKLGHMGGCKDYGRFWGPHYNTAPNIWGTQERDHNFESHPHS